MALIYEFPFRIAHMIGRSRGILGKQLTIPWEIFSYNQITILQTADSTQDSRFFQVGEIIVQIQLSMKPNSQVQVYDGSSPIFKYLPTGLIYQGGSGCFPSQSPNLWHV